MSARSPPALPLHVFLLAWRCWGATSPFLSLQGSKRESWLCPLTSFPAGAEGHLPPGVQPPSNRDSRSSGDQRKWLFESNTSLFHLCLPVGSAPGVLLQRPASKQTDTTCVCGRNGTFGCRQFWGPRSTEVPSWSCAVAAELCVWSELLSVCVPGASWLFRLCVCVCVCVFVAGNKSVVGEGSCAWGREVLGLRFCANREVPEALLPRSLGRPAPCPTASWSRSRCGASGPRPRALWWRLCTGRCAHHHHPQPPPQHVGVWTPSLRLREKASCGRRVSHTFGERRLRQKLTVAAPPLPSGAAVRKRSLEAGSRGASVRARVRPALRASSHSDPSP